MNDKKVKIMEACCIIEDALVISRIRDHAESDSLFATLKYLMKIGEITSEDLSKYQLNKNKNEC